jgi:hypothetical protein
MVNTCVILGMLCVGSNGVSSTAMKVTSVRSTKQKKSKVECESYLSLFTGAGRKLLSRATLKKSPSRLGLQLLHLTTAQFLPSSKWHTLSFLCLTLAVSIDYRLVVACIAATGIFILFQHRSYEARIIRADLDQGAGARKVTE